MANILEEMQKMMVEEFDHGFKAGLTAASKGIAAATLVNKDPELQPGLNLASSILLMISEAEAVNNKVQEALNEEGK